MSDIKEYNEETQELFLRFLLSDNDLFARCQNIVKPEFFNLKYRKAVDLFISHSVSHNAIPTPEQVSAVAGIKLEPIPNVTPDHHNWFMNEFETFCRHKALEKAIIESTDLLEKQDYGTVENKIKEASQVGLVKDLGLDYFENPKERLEWIKAQAGAISTGWKAIDQKLYGGVNRGEMSIFAGGSGAGKSLFLQNFAVNWVLAGYNVVYISLELSEQLISMRLDSMVSGYGVKEVMKNISDVDLKVRMKAKGAGRLRVKQMPNGVTSNDLRTFLREYEISCGEKVDCLLVDYLDLMMPISTKVSGSDLFIKDKYVSEELRNLAVERDLLFVTASQLNRGAVEEIEFDHHHIAGGISKVQTADNVVGIFTSNAMREKGRYQIQFMKTRSSSGVGTKVDLRFDPDTLRIEDLQDGDEDAMTITTGSLVDQLKRNNSIKADEPEAQDTVSQAMNMREFLKKNDL
jgi:KaiC/GvpD/RAD55 family RecA-like ATPase